jgi:hypothetical protein
MALRLSTIGLVLVLVSATAGTAQAQTQTHKMHLGPRLSYQFDAEEIGLGAQFSLPISSNLEFYPSLDVFFTDPSLWSFNLDLKWRVAPASVSWLYRRRRLPGRPEPVWRRAIAEGAHPPLCGNAIHGQ